MVKKMPKRIATTVINSLKGGVVPRNGLEYITVGRKLEIEALLQDIDIINEGGATFRFIVGKYGSGKSFLLQTIRNYAMDKNFVVIDADLSPERRLVGNKGQGLATYKELVTNMSTKAKPDGGALALILEKWLSQIQSQVLLESETEINSPNFLKEVNKKIFEVLNKIEGMVNGFDFARLISMYWKAYFDGDEELKSKIIRWFKGEYNTKTEARQDLGINIIISDDNWYDYIKIYAVFLVNAGYKGMLVLIDELVNIYKIPNSITRQYNYEKILTMYNDTLQGKAKHLGIIMGGTPKCIEDTNKGIFSYEALKSRLEEGRYAQEGLRDLLAPIIKLEPLSSEEMYVLVEKLADIHSELYGYENIVKHEELVYFLNTEFNRIGADSNITPREVIRDFIELLNLSFQNKSKTIAEIMGSNDFSYTENIIDEKTIHAEFAEFEV